MHYEDIVLKSPAQAGREIGANLPLIGVTGEKGQSRSPVAMIIVAVAAVLFVALWLSSEAANMHDAGFWQVSMTFVLFWLSVTQGMIALSAILRVTHASWRYPLTRILDATSLFGIWAVVVFGVYMAFGRSMMYSSMTSGGDEAFYKVWRNSAGATPVVYDAVFTFTAYLAGLALLWVTSIPDWAALRDRAGKKSVYTFLARTWPGSLWQGTQSQWRGLRLAEGFLVIIVMATFFASQTTQGWDFQLALGKDWDSSIFPFQSCLSALLAALAMTVLVMTALRKSAPGLITEFQYDSIGKFMIGFGLLTFYFRWCDYITAWYGHTPSEWVLQLSRINSYYPGLFVIMVISTMVLPIFAPITKTFRQSVGAMCTLSVLILIGVACQRFLDLMPAFAPLYHQNAMGDGANGWLALLGLGALFVLTYQIVGRFLPLVSWWGMMKSRSRTTERKLGNKIVTVMVEDPPTWQR